MAKKKKTKRGPSASECGGSSLAENPGTQPQDPAPEPRVSMLTLIAAAHHLESLKTVNQDSGRDPNRSHDRSPSTAEEPANVEEQVNRHCSPGHDGSTQDTRDCEPGLPGLSKESVNVEKSVNRNCSPGHDGSPRVAPFPLCKSTLRAPPSAWTPLSKASFRIYLAYGRRDQIPPVPKNRNTIWHENCGQMHAPEFCHGPLHQGEICSCAWCGGSDHITDYCLYIKEFMPDLAEKKRTWEYLLVTARQGLAPFATNQSLGHVRG